MRFFRVYEYAAPLLLFPLVYWLWLRRYEGDHRLVILVLSFPVLFAYIVPGLGTNWLKLWDFHTRHKIGRYRLHHGFLFGTMTSLFGIVCLDFPPRSFSAWEIAQSAFVMGSVVAFWNWLYDMYAVKVGLISVYNRKYQRGECAEAIVSDYGPVFFGSIGFCFGASLRICEYFLVHLGRWDLYWHLFLACNAAVLTVPVVAYVTFSVLTSGETGLRSYEEVKDEG
jgi:hypothetical protein